MISCRFSINIYFLGFFIIWFFYSIIFKMVLFSSFGYNYVIVGLFILGFLESRIISIFKKIESENVIFVNSKELDMRFY